MDIRNSLDGLKSLLGVAPSAPSSTPQPKSSASTGVGSSMSSDSATFSSAGNEVAQAASDSGVRMDKVTGIQAALASGSYNVSNAAIATSIVNSMLASA